MRKKIAFSLFSILLVVAASSLSEAHASEPDSLGGVWDNYNFSRPGEDWSAVAHKFGGPNALVDVVVAQTGVNGLVSLPFPIENTSYLSSSSQTDRMEPYLDKFDLEGLKVILSIQPSNVDVTQLIRIILSRYGHHSNIIGVNIDVEWKKSAVPNSVSDEERDKWLSEIKGYNDNFKLFLTYFKDYTHFPQDTGDLVILFDGEGDTQTNILVQYKELASHFTSVGIYTGYSSSVPPTATYERIMAAVPKTEYVIHTEDVFSNKPILMFELADVQVDWLESTSIDLMNLHMQKMIPVIVGVIPNNFDNPNVGGGYLPRLVKGLNQNYSDLFEIAQDGYTHNESEDLKGKSYGEQREIIQDGLSILKTLDIRPSAFIPPFGSADETTLNVAADLDFKTFVDLQGTLQSNRLLIINSWISLTDSVGNDTALKSPERIMSDIDGKTNNKVVIMLYQISDFQSEAETKLIEFSTILNTLKNSGKYRFMTANQFLASTMDQNTSVPTTQTQTTQTLPQGLSLERMPSWAFYVAAGAMVIAALFLIGRIRHRLRFDRRPRRVNS